MRFIILIVCLFAATSIFSQPPVEVVVDSDITLAEALVGSTAPENILRSLAIVDVQYYGYDGLLHRGQMVVRADLAGEVTEIFRRIEHLRFPVESVIPIRFDLPGGGTTMDTLNNSYSFHYRVISTYSTNKLSNHSYGTAIDINPFQNPAILRNGTVIPSGGSYDPKAPGAILRGDEVVKAFARYGWGWGGVWRSLKDYMHFEKK